MHLRSKPVIDKRGIIFLNYCFEYFRKLCLFRIIDCINIIHQQAVVTIILSTHNIIAIELQQEICSGYLVNITGVIHGKRSFCGIKHTVAE
jgi:hypothetical protein